MGDFNINSLLLDKNKKHCAVFNMLSNPHDFPLIAKNNDTVVSQYKKLKSILSNEGDNKLEDVVFKGQ